MRDSLRALSNEIVARDQNSVVSPISFMRDYSCLQPPLCPHSHTHTVYPSFSLNSKRVDSHTQNAITSAWRRWYDTWWWNTLMPKVTEKNRLNQQIFVWTQFILTPSYILNRPRFWGVFAHRSWVTNCRGPLVGSVHGNRRLNLHGGYHKLHTGFWIMGQSTHEMNLKKYFQKVQIQGWY